MNKKYIRADLFMNRIAGENPLTPDEIKSALELEPSDDVRPVLHAHWNKDADGRRCSNCKCLYWHKSVPATAYPYAYYCPHCGAKMDKTEENKVAK